MSALRGSPGRPVSSSALRWSIYVVIGLSLAGLLLRVTARTVALAQNGSSLAAATEALAPPTPSLAVAIVTAAPPTDTPAPTATVQTPTPTATATETPLPAGTQTAIYLANCSLYNRVPEDLLTYVDRATALPQAFVPDDLAIVPLDDGNVAFRPIPLRQSVHQPLLDMLDAMNQAGLSVWVMSGYRSYGEQQLAYDKWLKLYPDRAPDISAVPGHSEHQLGTAIDFSTPYMDELYSDFFHVNFYQTPEGQWLIKQAAYYGFTLSYPAHAVEATGYAWEPWHFRYVGILAQELLARNITLTEYLQECAPR
jgi:D-alanyl-D-alanine carboxypeptidase